MVFQLSAEVRLTSVKIRVGESIFVTVGTSPPFDPILISVLRNA
jgi:hypothetical protein